MSKPMIVGIDGTDHIRIHIKADTELGRMLSDFFNTPVCHSEWGQFKTAAGFSAFLRTGCTHPEIYQKLTGYQAMLKGRKEKAVHNPRYSNDYKSGLTWKVYNCQKLMDLFVQSDLPFVEYERTDSILVNHFTALRERLKANMRKTTSA